MPDVEKRPETTRRAVLARLGLAAGLAYAAPVLASLSSARASSVSFSGRPRRRPRPQARPRVRPEIVVSAPSAADIDRIAAEGYVLLSRDGIDLLGSQLARFRLPANVTVDQARAQVLQLVPAALFDTNAVYRPGALDCGEEGCAAFEMIGWRPELPACPAGTVIGMVDTSVNREHAALAGVDIEVVSSIAEGRRPASAVHGTGIAVLIAGRTDARTPGLLQGVRLVAFEAFHRDASGQDVADAFDIARAIDKLVGRGARVVNMSFTGPDNAVLAEVVRRALERDVIIVAAAGNQGPSAAPLYPAAYEGVVAVTAVDRDGNVYRQANAGEHIDFAAPGVRLWTAASVSGGRFRSGTSYAAPFVTAAFAVARARKPEARAADLVDEMARASRDLGRDGRDPTFGWGLVQSPGDCGGTPAPVPAVIR